MTTQLPASFSMKMIGDPEKIARYDEYTVQQKVVVAAIKIFCRCPFHVATVHMIADEAGVTDAMIMYYFKSKELLYREAFQIVSHWHHGAVDACMAAIKNTDRMKREAAETVFARIVHMTLDALFEDGRPGAVQMLIYEFFSPSPLHDHHNKIFFNPHLEKIVKLIMVIGENISQKLAMYHAVSIFSKIASFRQQNELLLGWKNIEQHSPQEYNAMKEFLIKSCFTSIRHTPVLETELSE